jgi:4-diphosphocytidyl-2-C-methyl-D-erythritol kinase
VTPRFERLPAAAKINLALLVGPRREDGFHDVATVMQRVDVCDLVELAPASALAVDGFDGDTLVRSALERLAEAASVLPNWHVRLEKRIPLAAGLGGGSADAAAALVLANRTLQAPLPAEALVGVAAGIGSDVPFFLAPGPKLAEGRGERLTPIALPQDFWILLAVEAGATKRSTASVYARFDELGGGGDFDERRAALAAGLTACRRPRDLAQLPRNDLAEAAGGSSLPERLLELGAFRADVSGAGPAAYGLFMQRRDARAAARRLPAGTRSWVAAPVW